MALVLLTAVTSCMILKQHHKLREWRNAHPHFYSVSKNSKKQDGISWIRLRHSMDIFKCHDDLLLGDTVALYWQLEHLIWHQWRLGWHCRIMQAYDHLHLYRQNRGGEREPAWEDHFLPLSLFLLSFTVAPFSRFKWRRAIDIEE